MLNKQIENIQTQSEFMENNGKWTKKWQQQNNYKIKENLNHKQESPDNHEQESHNNHVQESPDNYRQENPIVINFKSLGTNKMSISLSKNHYKAEFAEFIKKNDLSKKQAKHYKACIQKALKQLAQEQQKVIHEESQISQDEDSLIATQDLHLSKEANILNEYQQIEQNQNVNTVSTLSKTKEKIKLIHSNKHVNKQTQIQTEQQPEQEYSVTKPFQIEQKDEYFSDKCQQPNSFKPSAAVEQKHKNLSKLQKANKNVSNKFQIGKDKEKEKGKQQIEKPLGKPNQVNQNPTKMDAELDSFGQFNDLESSILGSVCEYSDEHLDNIFCNNFNEEKNSSLFKPSHQVTKQKQQNQIIMNEKKNAVLKHTHIHKTVFFKDENHKQANKVDPQFKQKFTKFPQKALLKIHQSKNDFIHMPSKNSLNPFDHKEKPYKTHINQHKLTDNQQGLSKSEQKISLSKKVTKNSSKNHQNKQTKHDRSVKLSQRQINHNVFFRLNREHTASFTNKFISQCNSRDEESYEIAKKAMRDQQQKFKQSSSYINPSQIFTKLYLTQTESSFNRHSTHKNKNNSKHSQEIQNVINMSLAKQKTQTKLIKTQSRIPDMSNQVYSPSSKKSCDSHCQAFQYKNKINKQTQEQQTQKKTKQERIRKWVKQRSESDSFSPNPLYSPSKSQKSFGQCQCCHKQKLKAVKLRQAMKAQTNKNKYKYKNPKYSYQKKLIKHSIVSDILQQSYQELFQDTKQN